VKELTGHECQELAMQVAAALGFEWKYRPPERLAPGDQIPTYADIVGPEGCTIRISHVWNDHNRVQVNGLWPKPLSNPNGGQWDFTVRSDELNKITCARSRGPAAIAQDIARRYIPKYLPLWRRELDRRKAVSAEFDQVRQAYGELRQASPESHFIEHNGRLSVGNRLNGATHSGVIELTYSRSDGQVEGHIDIRWVPHDKVLQIVKVLAA